jgi:hypothetical protein
MTFNNENNTILPETISFDEMKKIKQNQGNISDTWQKQEQYVVPDVITFNHMKQIKGITSPDEQVPQKRRSLGGKIVNFAKDVAKDAANTLIVKPVARATEATTRLIAPNSTFAQGYRDMANEGQRQNLKTLLGNYNVPTVKPFGQGGGKQIVGEVLDAASYIPIARGVGITKEAIKQPFKATAIQTAKSLGREGLVQGALSGAGKSLQEDKNAGQVVGSTIAGGALGGALGATLGVGGLALSRSLSKAPREFISNKIDASIRKIFSEEITADVGKIDEMAFGARKGFELLNKESQNISIPDTKAPLGSNITKPFDLSRAKPNEIISAVDQMGKKIVSNARKAAEEASLKGAKINVTEAVQVIKDAVSKGEIPLATARRIYRQIQQTDGDPVKVFDWVQSVNQKYKKKYQRQTINDTLLGKLADDIADVFRKELNVITDRTGYAEAFANNQELKRLIVAIAKKANRKVNFGDIATDAGLDAAFSLLTANPAFMARTASNVLFRSIISKIRNTQGVRILDKIIKNVKKIPTDTTLPNAKSKIKRLELPPPSGKPIEKPVIMLPGVKKTIIEPQAQVIRKYTNPEAKSSRATLDKVQKQNPKDQLTNIWNKANKPKTSKTTTKQDKRLTP